MTRLMTYSIMQQKFVREVMEFTICYSVRKVRSSYAGYCIRVRRSSDNTEQDIGFVGNDLDTSSLLSFCGSGNGFVSVWYNQGIDGSNYDVIQTIASRQPQIVSAGAVLMDSNKPALLYDGVDDTLETRTSPPIFLGTPISIFALANCTKVRPTTNFGINWVRLLGNLTDIYWFFGRYWDGTLQSMYGNSQNWQFDGSIAGDNANLTPNSDLTWVNARLLVSTMQDGNDNYLYANGLLMSKTTNLQMLSFSGRYSVGGIYSNDLTQVWKGFIQEVLIYRGQKTQLRSAIENNINNYFSVAGYGQSYVPSVFYSLRKVRSSYAGYCIRVRRSSDNTEQDIGFVGNDLDTSSLLSFCGSGNGFVTIWYDQGGRGINITQTTQAYQPQIVSAGVVLKENNKPALFSNSSTIMSITDVNWVLSQPSTHFIVGRTSTIINDKHYIDGIVTGTNRQLIGTAAGKLCLYGGAILNFGTKVNTQELIYGLFSSSVSLISRNGGTAISGNGGTQSLKSFKIFNGIVGSIQEIRLYGGNKSTLRTAIETEINSFYSIY